MQYVQATRTKYPPIIFCSHGMRNTSSSSASQRARIRVPTAARPKKQQKSPTSAERGHLLIATQRHNGSAGQEVSVTRGPPLHTQETKNKFVERRDNPSVCKLSLWAEPAVIGVMQK